MYSAETSRERPKSAPHLRLKDSKRISKCQVFSYRVPEKPKSSALSDFSTFLSQNLKKTKGDPLKTLKIFRESHNAEKTEGDFLISPSIVCCAEKKGTTLWLSSLGQIVQFDTLMFCRTL